MLNFDDNRISMLYKMVLIRKFEEFVSRYKFDRKIYGPVHCYNGEEAVAAGVCECLKETDYVISNHRPHGHAIAKGVDTKKIMAEIFGKATGTNGGKGGSMHIIDTSKGVMMSTGIVGSGIPVSLGTAFASKYSKNGRVTVLFMGDGTANEGTFYESLNLAAVWELPVIFVLEHNGLAITTQTKDTSAIKDYTKLAQVFGIKNFSVNGQNVEEVYNAASEAVEYTGKTSKPSFIQAQTIRFNEHSEGEYYLRMREKHYRDNDEVELMKETKDPIKLYSKSLTEKNIISREDLDEITALAEKQIEESYDFALNSPEPDRYEAYRNIFQGGAKCLK